MRPNFYPGYEDTVFSLPPNTADSSAPHSLIPPDLSIATNSLANCVRDENRDNIQDKSPLDMESKTADEKPSPVVHVRQLTFARPKKPASQETTQEQLRSAPREENIAPAGTTKMQALYAQLAPLVVNKLVFADGEPYLQHRDRINTYKKLSRIELIDKLRMLLPAGDRARYGKGVFEDIIAVFRAELDIGPAESAFNAHPGLVNARNGVVCVDDGDPYLVADDLEIRFTYTVDADFLPHNKMRATPAFDHFVSTSLDGDDEKYIQLLEFLGYVLSDATDGKVILFLLGASNSGKSVLCRWLSRMLDTSLVTHLPLHEVSNTFNGQMLCAAKLNISAEVDARPLTVDAMIKALSGGGDQISASRKFCDAKVMTPKTRLLCAANALPELRTGDPSDAIFNRLEILPFSRSIPREEQSLTLLEDLLEERSEIFTLAMYALAELISRNFRFTRSKEAEDILATYRTSANSFLLFEKECLHYRNGASVGCADAFHHYRHFCFEANLEPLPKSIFRSYLLSRRGVTEGSPRDAHRHQVRSYLGIELKILED